MADVSKAVAILLEGKDNGASAVLDKVNAAMANMAIQQAKGAAEAAAANEKWKTSAINLDLQAKAAAEAAAALKKQGEAAGEAGDATDKTSGKTFNLVSAMKLLAGSIVVKEFIDANVAAEQFNKAMTIITGSSAEAAKEFEFIKNLANTLGVEIGILSKSYISLSAASQGTALEGQATKDIFEAIVKAMTSLGKTGPQVESALKAVEQMMSKGTVSAEELRGQLSEHLPGAFQLAAAATGKTTQELGAFLKTGGLLTDEFLPKFADQINKTFGDTKQVSGYVAEMAKLKNAFAEVLVALGDAGAFNALTQGLAGVTEVIKSVAIEFGLWGKVVGLTYDAIKSGNFSGLGDKISTEIDKADLAFKALAASSASAGTGVKNFSSGVADEFGGTIQITEQTTKVITQLSEESKAASKILSEMGLNPGKLKDQVSDFQLALINLVELSGVAANQILNAFDKALNTSKNIEDINLVGDALATAFTNGDISASQFTDKVGDLAKKQTELMKAIDPTIKTMAQQKAEMDKAADAASKLELEYAKLKSAEFIKGLEFKAQIDVAQIQADVEKVKAAFESINNTITVTTEATSDLFKLFAENANTLTFSQLADIKQQIEFENKIKQEAFELQKQLVQAQIAAMTATTAKLLAGDALIKIDGAGLQPQLEAFMWEVLKAIQIKVNQDGLKLLLGV